MKKWHFYPAVILCLFVNVSAQMTVLSSGPANLAVAVALNTEIKFTFSTPLDTLKHLGENGWPVIMAKVDPGDSLTVTKVTYSDDLKTVIFQVNQKAGCDFVWLVGQAAGQGGQQLARPFALNYTTAAAYGSHTVSGRITSKESGPMNALVGLFDRSLFADSGPGPNRLAKIRLKLKNRAQDNGGPLARLATTIENPDGRYVLNLVRDGVYWPLAVKDMNADGEIDPLQDLLGFYDPDHNNQPDSIRAPSGSLANIDIELKWLFATSSTTTAKARLDTAIRVAKQLTSDQELKAIMIHQDTVRLDGTASSWAYIFYSPQNEYSTIVFTGPNYVMADTSRQHQPHLPYEQMKNIPDDFIDSDVVLSVAEANGGVDFRTRYPLAKKTLSGGNQFWAYPPDINRLFWVVEYKAKKPDNTDVSLHVLVDMTTGELITSGYSDIPSPAAAAAADYGLAQNYPNPFNPMTTIEYRLHEKGHVVLHIFDILGRELAILVDEHQEAGKHSVTFDASAYASGVLFYAIRINDFSQMKKMILKK